MLRLAGHCGTVHALAFSPNGQTLISAGKDETIRIWDVASRRERSQLLGHIGDVCCLALHGDGRVLASGGRDKSFRIWDLATGVLHEAFPKQMATVTGLAWLPGQATLAMVCGERMQPERGGELRLWTFKPPLTQVRNINVTGHGYWSLAAGAGPTIAFSGGDRSVSLWKLAEQQPHVFRQLHPSLHVAVSPNALWLAASVERNVRLVDISRRRERALIDGHKGLVTALAFSPDDRILAIGSRDQTVSYWLLSGGQPQRGPSFHWPTGAVTALAFSADGLLAAAGGDSGDIVIWDVDP